MIKCVIFDLDDTLCDYSSARENAKNLVNNVLDRENILISKFWDEYNAIEPKLFRKFINNEITKEEYRVKRYSDLLEKKHPKPVEFSNYLNQIYMEEANGNIKFFLDVISTLEKLVEDNILVSVLTNGPSDGQRKKFKVLNLNKYIHQIYISEEINYSKPNVKAFLHVLNDLNLKPEECLMVGDSIGDDIKPSEAVGIKAILIDRKNTYKKFGGIRIKKLNEIFKHL